jgi:cell division protein FtsW
MNKGREIDKVFFWTLIALVFLGFFIFISASLGVVAREGLKFSSLVFNQVFLGITLGVGAMLVIANINYRFWHKYAFYIWLFSLLLTLAVFLPGIGMEHGGARRWLNLGPLSFQPAEFLKIASIVYIAALFSGVRSKIKTLHYGLAPFLGVMGIVGLVLLLQPDTDSFLVIVMASGAMFFVAGAELKHIGGIIGSGIALSGLLILVRPYIRDRIMIFLNPASDPLGAGYQIQQSLIAVGSGRFTGRGLGQSIQKFSYLPEPIGDSIFAVYAEEWGFVGCVVLLSLFAVLLVRGLRIAAHAPNTFSRLIVVGIIVSIVSQAWLNIASMLGVFPLSGLPLTFVSHGGTALFFALAQMGVVLNVSKHTKEV